MVRFDRFSFSSPPRTASTWFLHAADMVGLPIRSAKNLVHIPPTGKERVGPGYQVSMVRHPVDWVASYYLSLRGGLIAVPAVDALADLARGSRNVGQMVRRCIENPGIIGAAFQSYSSNSSIRVEDLPWAAIEWFQMIGVPSSKTKILESYPAQNVRRWSPYDISKEERAALMVSELDFCERYEYF